MYNPQPLLTRRRYFPTGFPHSIQGLGEKGTEFLLIFDDGNFSEDSTFLLTDYLARTPKEVLSKNFRVDERVFDSLSQREKYIFQGTMPGSLDKDKKKVNPSKHRFTHRMLKQKPLKFPGGEVRITDSSNFPISKTIAAAHVTINPHALREVSAPKAFTPRTIFQPRSSAHSSTYFCLPIPFLAFSVFARLTDDSTDALGKRSPLEDFPF